MPCPHARCGLQYCERSTSILVHSVWEYLKLKSLSKMCKNVKGPAHASLFHQGRNSRVKSILVNHKKVKSAKQPRLDNRQTTRSHGRRKKPLHYPNAPLTEAILDIRVKLPSEIKPPQLKKVQLEEKGEYPRREEQLVVVGKMSVGEQVGASAKQTVNGYRFVSQDKRQIFQARIDGFTFNRLAPYETWESFRDEARRLWNVYRSIAKPQTITRLALRYINKLDLPLPLNDLKDYLHTIPEISPKMSQEIRGYFMQLQLPQQDLGAMLLLNQTLTPPPGPNLVSVILDLDLFCQENVPREEEDIWKQFEVLRTRKNEVFEACITNKTRRLIR